MTRRIVIVGGVLGDPVRGELLNQLKNRCSDIDWDWIQSTADEAYRPPQKYLSRLQTDLDRDRKQNPKSPQLTVVKSPNLHGQSANLLHRYCDPVLLPSNLSNVDDIVDWLLSADAKLIPLSEWYGNCREAALAAILSKLVKNRSWNKDTQGHRWTKEEDLLGQAPVLRRQFQPIHIEAGRMLGQLEGKLLISKGGTPGTPKEWCIHLKWLPLVKKIILDQSFSHLNGEPELETVRNSLTRDDRRYRIDGEIINERVRGICRS